MILGCLTFTSSPALFWRDIKELEFYAEEGQNAVFQADIQRLPEGTPVIYLGQIEQKLVRTKAPNDFSVRDDRTIVFIGGQEKTEFPVARVLTWRGLGYVLLLKLKAFDETSSRIE